MKNCTHRKQIERIFKFLKKQTAFIHRTEKLERKVHFKRVEFSKPRIIAVFHLERLSNNQSHVIERRYHEGNFTADV